MWKDLLAGIGMGMVLPGMLLNFGVMLLNRPLPEVQMAMVVTEAAEETAGVSETEMDHEPIQIGMRSPAGDVQNLDLEEYLVGVVLAEMPAWFEEEALKAQALWCSLVLMEDLQDILLFPIRSRMMQNQR